jgi:thiamine pyrophosphate-dependent acetolactate synthase large subunit-like protein
VANNRSFFNDELHQERVARIRSRPPENRWIGQRISEPDIDIAAMARAQGCPAQRVETHDQLEAALDEALADRARSEPLLLEVVVEQDPEFAP